METIMQTLDTKDPSIEHLVFAVIDKKQESDTTIRFEYLEEDTKKKLVEEVNNKNKDK